MAAGAIEGLWECLVENAGPLLFVGIALVVALMSAANTDPLPPRQSFVARLQAGGGEPGPARSQASSGNRITVEACTDGFCPQGTVHVTSSQVQQMNSPFPSDMAAAQRLDGKGG
jgi:hypothetical protein